MNMESILHQEMIGMYYNAGKETGYWANYFLRSVKKNGGLKIAKKMLSKRLKNLLKQKGFQRLIEVGRPDLSLENLVIQSRFRNLFTSQEIEEANHRLAFVPEYAQRTTVPVDKIYAEDIFDEQEYVEGSKKRITINAYERNSQAKSACLKRYGYSCQVCGMNFQSVYGDIGKHFIHVHHKKPLAGRRVDYKIKPTIDLVPVCPNCHAMLHTSNPPIGIEELKEKMANK